MLSIIAAILLFGFIVLMHELGHFVLAKVNGIPVVEFSLGMGPQLFHVKKGETIYSIRILPFGGYCMMLGEDSENPNPESFSNKPVLARIAVIAAGPLVNFLLAFLFAFIIAGQVGHDDPILYSVLENYPASEAGLQAGDKITKVNNRNVFAYRDVMLYMFSHPGEPLDIRYERPNGGSWENGGASEKRSTTVVPVYDEERQTYMLGVHTGYRKIESIGKLIQSAAYEVKYCVVSTFDSFGMIIRKQINVGEAVAGPMSIVSMVGETVEQSSQISAWSVFLVLSNWVVLLSSSLGLMNLLPIPALDGGRLVFLFLELVRGKPLDPKKEGFVHMLGMMALMALMVLVLFNDIRRIF